MTTRLRRGEAEAGRLLGCRIDVVYNARLIYEGGE